MFGDTRSSDACVGKPSTFGVGAAVHFSWCQPRPRIHSPGFAVFTASATIATISSHDRRVHQVQVELRLADAGEVAVPFDEPGDDELALHVDHLRGRPDVASMSALAAERHDPIAANGDRLRLGLRLLDRDELPLVRTRVGRRRRLRVVRRRRPAAQNGSRQHEEA